MRLFFYLTALMWSLAADRLFADGIYWQKLVVDSTDSPPHLFTAVAIDFWQNIFAGTRQSEIYRSGDDGSTWCLVHKNSDIHANASYPIKFIAVMPTGHLFAALTGDGLYLSFEGHVLYSADRGAHFTRVSIPGLTATISCFSVDRDGALYFGTEGNGIWRSDDRGNSWLKESLADSVINDLTADSSGRIYEAANSGLNRRMENSIFAQRRSRISDRTMSLVTAYPNPFNALCRVRL